MDHIVTAAFTAVYPNGPSVTIPCQVDLDSKEVLGVTDGIFSKDDWAAGYVTVNGKKYPAVCADERGDKEGFWYV